MDSRWESLRRHTAELLGRDTYSRPARDNLDAKLEKYLPAKGFFVEAGAHDGFSDSNTYFLEKIKGWRGLLIEPMPGNYRACIKQRPNSRVVHSALVAEGYPDQTVKMTWGDRMSWVEGAYNDDEAQKRRASVKKWLEPTEIEVPARTLNSIFEEAGVSQIDFFSLDVEGYELQVLQGLDLTRFAPRFFLIECQTVPQFEEIRDVLATHYALEAQLSHHDYLFAKR